MIDQNPLILAGGAILVVFASVAVLLLGVVTIGFFVVAIREAVNGNQDDIALPSLGLGILSGVLLGMLLFLFGLGWEVMA